MTSAWSQLCENEYVIGISTPARTSTTIIPSSLSDTMSSPLGEKATSTKESSDSLHWHWMTLQCWPMRASHISIPVLVARAKSDASSDKSTPMMSSRGASRVSMDCLGDQI